jgi:hypothetical protein
MAAGWLLTFLRATGTVVKVTKRIRKTPPQYVDE